MYAYSDMECLHRHCLHNFLSFQAIYCLFAQLLTPKIKIRKNLDILSFYTCVPLIRIICMVPEIWSSTDRIFFVILGNFLLFYLANTLKNEKNPRDIIILHKCTKNHDHLLYCSRDIAHDGCNCYFHFGLSGVFSSTFLQPVNGRKNST